MNNNKYLLDEEINLLFMYGGFKGYYYIGTNYIINKYINCNKIKKITGISAGSFACVLFACNIDINTFNDINNLFIKNGNINYLRFINILKYKFINFLPEDAYKICNKKKVRFIVTKVLFGKLEKVIIKNFKSNKELINSMVASSTIPFITHNIYPYCTKIKSNYYIDGFFSYNEKKQSKTLVLNSFNISIKNNMIFDIKKQDINKIIFDGMYDMYIFLISKKNTDSIYLNEEKNLKNYYKYNIINKFIILYIILIITNLFIKNNKIINIKFIIDIIILIIIIYLYIHKFFNN